LNEPSREAFDVLIEKQTDNIKRWETCVLNAHEPQWRKTGLAAASRAELKAIDLHFHDLRHEGASRLLEAGWPLHHVHEMLGHISIEQTSTYLNVERVGLQASMRKSDELRNRCNPLQSEAVIEHPLPRNDDRENGGNVTVN
jgi:integrase